MKMEYHLAYKSLHTIRGIANFIVLISPNNLIYETSVHSEYFCTNSQAEYEALHLFIKVDIHGCEGHRCWKFASGSTTK
jgi:hypothetical protein